MAVFFLSMFLISFGCRCTFKKKSNKFPWATDVSKVETGFARKSKSEIKFFKSP